MPITASIPNFWANNVNNHFLSTMGVFLGLCGCIGWVVWSGVCAASKLNAEEQIRFIIII